MDTIRMTSVAGVSWQAALEHIFLGFIEIADEKNCLRPKKDEFKVEHPQQPPEEFNMDLTLTCTANIRPEKGRLQYIAYEAIVYPQGLSDKELKYAYGIVSCEAHL